MYQWLGPIKTGGDSGGKLKLSNHKPFHNRVVLAAPVREPGDGGGLSHLPRLSPESERGNYTDFPWNFSFSII